MKEYKYERVAGKGIVGFNFYDYRDIVDSYAKRGYRFVTCVPVRIVGYGKIVEIDLVFERDI